MSNAPCSMLACSSSSRDLVPGVETLDLFVERGAVSNFLFFTTRSSATDFANKTTLLCVGLVDYKHCSMPLRLVFHQTHAMSF